MTSAVWNWRKAIKASALQATTRHVLGNLADYMDKEGKCFPSTKRQAKDTGLSERAVCEHLKKAEAAGYLRKGRKYDGTKAWARHEYFAAFPPGVEGAERRSEGAEPHADGTDRHDTMALTEGQSNYHSKLPEEAIRDDVIFQGKIITLTEKAFYMKLQHYGLDLRQFVRWLNERDRWLRKLSDSDRRVINWWDTTWKALDADAEGLRKSSAYAALPAPEPTPPPGVVWG